MGKEWPHQTRCYAPISVSPTLVQDLGGNLNLKMCSRVGKSRHTVVCSAAKEAGMSHREYIDRKNYNAIFTHA